MAHKASYILTWRDEPGTRRRDNLFAVLAWLQRHPMFKPIVVEQDSESRLSEALPHPDCLHFFAYNPGSFNRSWGLNVGYKLSKRQVLAFADADLVLGDALGVALGRIAPTVKAVRPNRRVIVLDEAESARVRGGEFDWMPARNADVAGDAAGNAAASSALLIEREAFALAGGWDERILEAVDANAAFDRQLLRAQIQVTDQDARPAVRMHSQTARATGSRARAATSRQVLDEYRQLSDARLERLAEIQMQLMGNSEKYQS